MILLLLSWVLLGLALLTSVALVMLAHTLWSDRSERSAFKKLIDDAVDR